MCVVFFGFHFALVLRIQTFVLKPGSDRLRTTPDNADNPPESVPKLSASDRGQL